MIVRKLLTVIFSLFILCDNLNAQNPFKKFGYEVKVFTMSKGKFNEFFDLDTIQQIGEALLNTNTMKVIGFVKKDTVNPMPEPQLISRWISPDPLAEEYYSISPYHFSGNNPIRFVDPNGMNFGDYYTVDGQYLGSDHKDDQKVYVVHDYRKVEGGYKTGKTTLLTYNDGTQINHDDFKKMVKAVYYEMSDSKTATSDEAAAMYSTVENRAEERGQNELAEFKTKGKDGKFQIRGWSKSESSEKLILSKEKSAISGILKAAISNTDFSNGAFFWHGKDLGQSGTPANLEYYKNNGLHFSKTSHNIWNLSNIKKPGINGGKRWNYKYTTTAAFAHTSFMKLNKWWKIANGHKGNL